MSESRPDKSKAALEALSAAQRHATRKTSAAQRTPLGRRVLTVVQNLAWVVPLTLLIWVYAERDLVDTMRGVSVPLTVRSERADRVVTLITPVDHQALVDIQGTRPRLDDALKELRTPQGLVLIIPAKLPLGDKISLSAVEVIGANPIFDDLGIKVVACAPIAIEVKIDQMDGRDVAPQVPDAIKSRLEGTVVFDPPLVKLRGPLSELNDPAHVVVIADIAAQMLPKVPGEQDIAAPVPVRLAIPSPNITLSPATVRVRVKIRPADVSYAIPSVPVFVSGPVSLLDKYRVNFPNGPFIPRITVTGPEDQINRIKSGDVVVKATLEIQQKDVGERLPRSPSYTLPPGVSVSDEDRVRTVQFELVERARLE